MPIFLWPSYRVVVPQFIFIHRYFLQQSKLSNYDVDIPGGEVLFTLKRQLDNSSSALIVVLIVAQFASVLGISFSGVENILIFTIGLSTLWKEYGWNSLLW
jgi:hypothetical protein